MPRRFPARQVGLARALSKLGYCSRARAAELIRAGHVLLNGRVRRDPESPVSLEQDKIAVNGEPVAATHKLYFVLNKPRGIVTTASDEKGRQTVYDLIDPKLPWLAPVGRLDKASEGLLLLTNDSEWAARITAPETHLDKTYHVQVNVLADPALLDSIRHGIQTTEGDFLRAKSARLLRSGTRNCWIEVILDEGRNRHIRRMLDELGVEVLRLVRVSIGPLLLAELPKGAVRPLTHSETRALDPETRTRARARKRPPA